MDSFFALGFYQAGQACVHKTPLERTAAKLHTTRGKNTPVVYEISVAITSLNEPVAYGGWLAGISKKWSKKQWTVFKAGENELI